MTFYAYIIEFMNRLTRCISQGSVRTRVRSGGQFYRHYVVNSFRYLLSKMSKRTQSVKVTAEIKDVILLLHSIKHMI